MKTPKTTHFAQQLENELRKAVIGEKDPVTGRYYTVGLSKHKISCLIEELVNAYENEINRLLKNIKWALENGDEINLIECQSTWKERLRSKIRRP